MESVSIQEKINKNGKFTRWLNTGNFITFSTFTSLTLNEPKDHHNYIRSLL